MITLSQQAISVATIRKSVLTVLNFFFFLLNLTQPDITS